MSVKRIIQESLDKNPLGVKEALEEALQDRVRVALEEKYEEMMEAKDDDDDDDDDEDDEDMKEDFDQLDEISKKTLSSYVKKAKKDKAYHDREADAAHHDDRMAGASDHKARSIGRKMGIDKAKKKMKESFDLSDLTLEELEDFMMSEDFDQLDEISKKTLSSYVKKAKKDKAYHDREADAAHHDDRMAGASDHKARSIGRKMGIDKAKDRLAK